MFPAAYKMNSVLVAPYPSLMPLFIRSQSDLLLSEPHVLDSLICETLGAKELT